MGVQSSYLRLMIYDIYTEIIFHLKPKTKGNNYTDGNVVPDSSVQIQIYLNMCKMNLLSKIYKIDCTRFVRLIVINGKFKFYRVTSAG